jgi:TDG/mug DNA glycosylase family protein
VDRATIDVYEARAADWARLRPPRYAARAATFAERCLPGLVRLDAGCGPGSYFADLGRPLAGLDGAHAMLLLGRRAAPDALLVQGDLAALPFAPASLGGAWARASYLHLTRQAVPAALAELHRALAPGAPFDLTVREGDGEGPLAGDDFPGRFFALWRADDIRDVLHGAGFTVEGLEGSGEWLSGQARRARTLPDFVGPGMRVLVCGLNPSLVAADAGYGFAGATNRFWPAALASGLVTVARKPPAALARDRVGMTDLVKRATTKASEVGRVEYAEGAARVERLVRWLDPGLVLFVGLEGWRAAVRRGGRPGPQPEGFGGVPAYVMPSTSGRNAATSTAELIAHMREALAYSARR